MKKSGESGENDGGSGGEWACSACTFLNYRDLIECEMCSTAKSSSSPTSAEWTRPYAGSSSSSSAQEVVGNCHGHRKCSSEAAGSIDNEDIMSLLQDALQRDQRQFTLCLPRPLHQTQRFSYGAQWSCGYRNIQMLCSALIQIDEYRQVLFAGDGVIPSIGSLQAWIERAWGAGFDPEVCLGMIYFFPHFQ